MDVDQPGPLDSPPSKSQLKRDAHALLKLGRELAGLPQGQLAALPLDEDLVRELALARSIRSNVARKRQLQFVAKLMRNRDMSPVITAMQASRSEARQVAARHHRVEAWRDRLLQDGDSALSVLLDRYPDGSAQALRQLLRNARRESDLGKPPAAARKLFRMLRDMDSLEALPDPGAS